MCNESVVEYHMVCAVCDAQCREYNPIILYPREVESFNKGLIFLTSSVFTFKNYKICFLSANV